MDTTRVGRIAARWTTELAVVFVGVYGAFALSEWEEDREQAERADQVRAALIEEIRGIQKNTSWVARSFPGALSEMQSKMEQGETPPLAPMIEPIGFRTHVWESTMASGGLGLFDVETFYDISEFYNLLNAGFEQLAQLRELSETMLVPRLGEPPAHFYEAADSGRAVRLRPEYVWYVQGMQRTQSLARCITVIGDSVLIGLGATPDTTLGPLSPADC